MNDGGLKRFQRRMRAVRMAAPDAIRPALMRGAYEIADAQEALAPEDTGDLKGSIQVTGPGKATPAYSQPGGSQIVPVNQVAVTVGNADVRYPHLVEYGSVKGPAQPFFWPGFRLARSKAERRIKREIGKAVRGAWNGR